MRPHLIAVATALAFAALLVSLPHLLAVDAAVWSAVLAWRGCGTDATVERLGALATGSMAVLVAVACVARLRAGGDWRRVWTTLAVAAVGMLANTTMKAVFDRARPSNLPDILVGHSFPSGHVMNTVLAAIVVIVLTRGLRRERAFVATAVALVLATAAERVLSGHHWLLDTMGALLAATMVAAAWLPWFARRPLAGPALAVLALAAILGVARSRGGLIELPAPLTTVAARASEVVLGTPAAALAQVGAWEGPSHEAPAGSMAWLTGAGTVALPPAGAHAEWTVAFGARPESGDAACVRVRVSAGGRTVASFVPFEGWREYRVDAGAIAPEAPLSVRFEAEHGDGSPARLAVAYVRLVPDETPSGTH